MKALQTCSPVDVSRIRLTPREREVLALLCEGLSNKLISRELGISVSTVKIHVSNIFAELNVSSRLQAVVIARRYGLIRERTPDAEDLDRSDISAAAPSLVTKQLWGAAP